MRNIKQWYTHEPFQAFWEKGYRSLDVSAMGIPSFEVAEIIPFLGPNAKVLDLGCGEGRNALYLSGIGCQVTAVDRSAAGIHKLQTVSKSLGLNIETHIGEIQNFHVEEDYDLVMAHGVLYYLENPVWRNLLNKVKEHTKAGGFNIFTVFVYSESYPCPDEFHAAGYRGSFAPNELREFFDDWLQYRADQYVKWDCHPDISMHYHPIEKLVCRKPGGIDLKLSAIELETGEDIDQAFFDKVEMGMQSCELLRCIGNPHCVNEMFFKGSQYGVSHQSESNLGRVLMKDYSLALWYYGRYIFYIVSEEVTGKALYSSKPVKLVHS